MSTNPYVISIDKLNQRLHQERDDSQYLGISRRQRLWLIEGKKCHWCHQPTRLSDDHAWDVATIDHVIPRYKGGVHEESNMVSACNRCNNRRNHEDVSGLPEGSLIGKYKLGDKVPSPNANKPKLKHVALTGDEKKVITAKVTAYQNHIEQRDQALKEINKLRKDLLDKQVIVDQKDAEITALQKKIATITVMMVFRKRIATWLLR